MAERAIRAIRTYLFSQSSPQAFAPLGMRGGLGKTLLIAFLLLAIVPLSLLAFFTYHQIERDSQARLGSLLEDVVVLKEGDLRDWFEARERALSLAAVALEEGVDSGQMLVQTQALEPAFVGLTLVGLSQGTTIASTGVPATGAVDWRSVGDNHGKLVFVQAPGSPGELLPAIGYRWDDRLLVGLLSWDLLERAISASPGLGEGATARLVTEEGQIVSQEGQFLPSAEASWGAGFLSGPRGQGVARYPGEDGIPVMGAYLWSPRLGVGIIVEQPRNALAAPAENLTALVIGATLVVALMTAAIAAVVTRRITRPIIQLTETAAWMARGDLNQRVPIVRKDEIGVLARVFNHMAAELRVLYGSLEAKVAERTAQLEEANRNSRYYIMQLSISAEVARVASSIRELDQLLDTVATLIGRAFELKSASIYLLDETGRRAVWQAGSAGLPLTDRELKVDGPSLVGQVAAHGDRRVLRQDLHQEGYAAPVACEMAVPLCLREQILGVLYLQSERPEDFGDDDQLVYRSLADQIAIAIENARVYGLERETIHRLRELDEIQAEFLVNMSHALRTPLNSIIGFSRVMLKELDGPLSDLQRADLETIHDSGRQLLGLINDMLELSQLELGVAPFSASEVDLEEILEGVMATTQALVRNKRVRLTMDVPVPAPSLYTDGQRLRQVILALMSNAVKYTDEGSIRLQIAETDGAVKISVSDTGAGIPRVERERIFANGGHEEGGDGAGGGGFGLAISKRVVERLGGEIWVESEEGVGSTFTFTLPCDPAAGLPARG
jgi:signal transduction histidine kinase/HAMP domain-containing protein